LVGDEARLKKELKANHAPASITIQKSTQVIGMNESPMQAIKQKKDASIIVAVNLVKEGKADGVVSAGNTGAYMAAALFGLGRIKGIERPAIATIFPNETGSVLLLDMGANADCKPKHLEQFGLMGSLYAQHVMHLPTPRVGLINIGEEKEKGNELIKESWPLLKVLPINFIGNVESKEVMTGGVDVVVCDGFIGNLILKFSESIAYFIINMLKKEIKKSFTAKIGAMIMMPALKKLQKKIDYDEFGAAPLLGIDGVCFKAHGRAKAKAITNAIRVAAEAVKEDMVGAIAKFEEHLEEGKS
jgi:glycerol-3-phosphate acyltransferase PlsX